MTKRPKIDLESIRLQAIEYANEVPTTTWSQYRGRFEDRFAELIIDETVRQMKKKVAKKKK